MKKGWFYFFIIAVFLFEMSCRKALNNVNDYFPKVKTVSAVVQTDGSVLVNGQIISDGYSAIEYLGFCCATNSNPNMVSMQKIVTSPDGTNFSVAYPASSFIIDSVYYFRTWAANDNGYSLGNSIKLDSTTVASVTAPCTNTMNTVNLGIPGQSAQNYYSIDTVAYSSPTWYFTATSLGSTVTFELGSPLTTGTFTTLDINSMIEPGPRQAIVTINQGNGGYGLNYGSTIYVNKIGTNSYDISICSAPWLNGGSTTYYFNTRLTAVQVQ